MSEDACAEVDATCPGCGTPTELRRASGYVHRSYCLTCTELEIGMTHQQVRDRATKRIQGVAKKKWRVTT